MALRASRILLVGALLVVLVVNCSGPSLIGNSSNQKVAVILPGKLDDQDYNQLAYEAGKSVENEYGLQVDYFEEVSVPELTNLVADISAQKYTIVWIHGSQFDAQAFNLAQKYPQISFIMEGDLEPDELPDNMWFIDRNFQLGAYVVGRLAVEKTQTAQIGYVCGLSLPFSFIELHAIQQAIQDSGKQVELIPIWTGDFNDPTAARASTAALLDSGADVIIGSLNQGMVGVVDEIQSRSSETWFTGKYKSKSELSPSHFMTSIEMDFAIPLKEIINNIFRGQKSGYYGMEFGRGLGIIQPVQNVSPELDNLVTTWVADVTAGRIVVMKDSLPMDTPDAP